MKFSRFLVPVLVFALLGFCPAAARALNVPAFDPGNNAAMPANLVQLFTDLATIAPDSTATDAQHQALVADLDALAAGIFTPDPAAVDQLATDLATAAASGLFSDNVIQYIADDFIGDPDTPESWLEDIQDDVASLINPPPDLGDPGDPTGFPVETGVGPLISANVGRNSGSCDRFTVPLTAQGIPKFLLENYSGRVQLTVTHILGIAPLPTVILDTAGLPPSDPYTVSITRQSDGASLVLGQFRVRDSFYLPPILAAPLVPSSAKPVPAAEIATFSHTSFGGIGSKHPLPADYDAADVAILTVTDAQGIVRLSGDIANGQRMSELKKLNLHLSGSPVVQGHEAVADLVVRHRAILTKTSDGFRLAARHLPVNTPVTLLADGVEIGRYTTTTHGHLLLVEGYYLRKLLRSAGSQVYNGSVPDKDLSGTKTFSLTDALGNVLLSGSVVD